MSLNIENPSITQVKLANILEYIYEDRWEMTETNITIYFPEVTIRNGSNKPHNITDLYIRMEFKGDGTLYPSLSGIRASALYSEIYCDYVHSHLSGGRSSFLSWHSFCLGSTTVKDQLFALTEKMDLMQFEVLLYRLKDYVAWESLSGGPYRRISSIDYSIKNSADGWNEIYTNILMEKGTLEVNYKNLIKIPAIIDNIKVSTHTNSSGTTFSINPFYELEELFYYLEEVPSNVFSQSLAKIVYQDPNTKKYYFKTSGTNYNNFHDRSLFTFNKKQIRFKILNYINNDTPQTNKRMVASPLTIKRFKNTFERDLSTYYNSKGSSKAWYNSDFTRNKSANKIFV